MGRNLLIATIDLLAGFIGAGLVILATDATRADLRVYLLAAVAVFFALGLWRAGSEGWPAGLRVLLISLVPLILGAESLVRHWPPDLRGLSYTALFPFVQWASAWAGFKIRRRPGATARRLWLALGGAVALAGVVGALTMPAYSRFISTYTDVRPAPAIAFETLDSEPVSSEEWQGKVVVLDFWASWCMPCVAELEELDVLYENYRDRDDVVFWAVSAKDERDKAARWAADSSLSLPWAYDPGDIAFETLEAATIPCIFLIDRQGRIRLTHIGYTPSEGFLEHVGALLEELVAEPAA